MCTISQDVVLSFVAFLCVSCLVSILWNGWHPCMSLSRRKQLGPFEVCARASKMNSVVSTPNSCFHSLLIDRCDPVINWFPSTICLPPTGSGNSMRTRQFDPCIGTHKQNSPAANLWPSKSSFVWPAVGMMMTWGHSQRLAGGWELHSSIGNLYWAFQTVANQSTDEVVIKCAIPRTKTCQERTNANCHDNVFQRFWALLRVLFRKISINRS